MGKVELVDDIMAPRDAIMVKFEGKNPFGPMTMIPKLLRYVLKVSSKDIKEPDIRWEVEGDKRKFYGKWVGKRKEDNWSTTRLRVIIQGEMSSKERTGWCNIEIKGVVLTNYNYNNFIQRIFWFFYNKTFYYKHRRMYMDYAKDNIYEIRDRLQRALGIEVRE